MSLPDRHVVTPPGAARPFGVWLHAIEVRPGRLLFVSGLTARDGAGAVVGVGDVAGQTRTIPQSLDATLRAAGGALGDVASVVVYVTDVGDFDAVHAVPRRVLPARPACLDDGRGQAPGRPPVPDRDQRRRRAADHVRSR